MAIVFSLLLVLISCLWIITINNNEAFHLLYLCFNCLIKIDVIKSLGL